MATWGVGCSGCSRRTPDATIATTAPRAMCGRDGSRTFPVQDDDHLVRTLRYVERNALRAELVARAEDWKWSSLPGWQGGDPLLWREILIRDERWLERGAKRGTWPFNLEILRSTDNSRDIGEKGGT